MKKWKPIDERKYEHEVIWPNDDHYETLLNIQADYPELTFQNNGYEYLRKDIQEKHKEQIDEISAICKETVAGFVKFNNFKERKNGAIVLRLQYKWSSRFVGVGYFEIDYWNEKIHAEISKEDES